MPYSQYLLDLTVNQQRLTSRSTARGCFRYLLDLKVNQQRLTSRSTARG